MLLTNEEISKIAPVESLAVHLLERYQLKNFTYGCRTYRFEKLHQSRFKNHLYRMKFSLAGNLDVSILRVASSSIESLEHLVPGASRRSPHAKECGLVMVFSAVTGELLLILQDHYITRVSHAASIALSAALAWRHSLSVRVALLGFGAQAKLQIQFLSRFVDVSSIKLYAPRHDDAIKMKDWCQTELWSSEKGKRELNIAPTITEAVSNADIVLIATSSRTPIEVPMRVLKSRVHVSTTRPAEASSGLLEGAKLLVTPGAKESYKISDESHIAKKWCERYSTKAHTKQTVSLDDFILSPSVHFGRESKGVCLYCALGGADTGPLLLHLVEYMISKVSVHKRSVDFNQALPS